MIAERFTLVTLAGRGQRPFEENFAGFLDGSALAWTPPPPVELKPPATGPTGPSTPSLEPEAQTIVQAEQTVVSLRTETLCLRLQSAGLEGVVAELVEAEGGLRCRLRAEGASKRRELRRLQGRLQARLGSSLNRPVHCEVRA